MNTTADFLVVIAEHFGWALVHSLWQGALVAALLSVVLRLMRRQSAGLRHGVCLLALLGLAAAVAVTGWMVRPGSPGLVGQNRPAALRPGAAAEVPSDPVPAREPASSGAGEFAAPGQRAAAGRASAISQAGPSWGMRIESMLPNLCTAWVMGVSLLSVRHLVGWRRLRRWRRQGLLARAELQERFGGLLPRFAHTAGVSLLESAEAAVPMLAGLLKPVVLVPVSVISGLSARELEAIFAHELAHLARRDGWSNLLQVAVETLLFHHPAVWWIGHRAREERERAADDLALEVCTDRRVYAGALTRLAELRLAQATGLSATGGSLLARIHRIMRPAAVETPASGWSIGVPTLLVALGLAVLVRARGDEAKTISVAAGESIQAAIDAAPSGAVIHLSAGEWKERIVISKPLTLEGEGWEKTRIAVDELPADDLKKAYAEVEVRQQAASTPAEKAAVATDRVRLVLQPAVWVRDAREVAIRKLRVQGLSRRGNEDGLPNSTLVYCQGAHAAMSECAIVGPFGNGVQVTDESDVEVRQSLVAALWSEGIVVQGRGEEHGPSRLRLVGSEVRNIYHYGVSIGRGCDSTLIERCRISGTAWHGVRYDDASPTIKESLIFQNARSGIYASGTTRATVSGNLFWKNEMDGISCWFNDGDTIEDNTFAGNLREGLAVIGGAKPTVTRNIFSGSPIAIVCGATSGRDRQPTPVGAPVLTANLFWETPVVLRVKEEHKPAPEGSLAADPRFRDPAKQDFALAADSPARAAGIGVIEPLAAAGPWPLLAEEKAIIPADDTRDSRYWTAPGGTKKSKAAEALASQAQANARQIVSDAFQLDDAGKREAAIEHIRALLSDADPARVRVGLAAFTQVGSVQFDKASFRPGLRPLLASPEADIRSQALGALGQIGPSPEDLDRALAMVDDPAGDVRAALPFTLKWLSPEGFTGKTGDGILKLLDRADPQTTKAVWHAMWGTKISPELETRVVAASRADDQGSGYSEVFYHALTVHQSKREPTITRLIELLASQDTTNVAGRVLWGLQQGVAPDQEARVAEAALRVLAARSDEYMRRQALGCLQAYGTAAHAEPLRALLAKPGVTGEFRQSLEAALAKIEARAAK